MAPSRAASALALLGLVLVAGCGQGDSGEVTLSEHPPPQETAAAQRPEDEAVAPEPTEAERVARILPGPDLELLGLDGERWRLSDERGRVVLVNFWATWCLSCRGEMPELAELQSEFGDLGVTIVGIATDRDPAKVGPYIEELGVEYPILLDPTVVSAKLFGGVEGYPKTFILGQQGLLYSSYLGARSKAVFEKDLRYLLEAPPSEPSDSAAGD
jgi:thiol-disulfide isomerase/thioredoxin